MMAASFATLPTLSLVNTSRRRIDSYSSKKRVGVVRCCSGGDIPEYKQVQRGGGGGGGGTLKECAITLALSLGLIAGGGAPSIAYAANPAIPQVSVLISGPPIKDPGALLRYALPIDNKAIREVQKPLEDITDSLKIAGVKALDSVERVSCFMVLID